MDTLAVALRVAEEAIEEAISKAEAYGDSLVQPPPPLCGEVWVRAAGRKCRLSGNRRHRSSAPPAPAFVVRTPQK